MINNFSSPFLNWRQNCKLGDVRGARGKRANFVEEKSHLYVHVDFAPINSVRAVYLTHHLHPS